MRRKNIACGDLILDISAWTFTLVVLITTLFPFIYVFSCSISDPAAVNAGKVLITPVGFTLKAYTIILSSSELWLRYYNTLWYVVVGTFINVVTTVIAAYPLSRKSFSMRNKIMFMFTFTMFFSGGMVPSFILINHLGLMNTRWAIVIPSAASAWYIIIARTYILSIPESLIESAKIDGAKEVQVLLKIILPLCKPIMAVIVLWACISYWNTYFQALLFLNDQKLHPIQLYLAKVLLSQQNKMLGESSGLIREKSIYINLLKYAVIIVTIFPILCVYPFLQKYFIKGIMIGSIKG